MIDDPVDLSRFEGRPHETPHVLRAIGRKNQQLRQRINFLHCVQQRSTEPESERGAARLARQYRIAAIGPQKIAQ